MTSNHEDRKVPPYSYSTYATVVDKYVQARNQDLIPDHGTEQVLAMGGTMGRKLYGAFKTLQLHGRFSRTMVEQALLYSPTSYPEYIKLWLSSLPPKSRSFYTADLYNNNFTGLVWDDTLYRNVHQVHEQFVASGSCDPVPSPPIPLGDNRHSPRMALIAEVAHDFHALFNSGCLFGARAGDVHAPLNLEYLDVMGYDILDKHGKLFGVTNKEDCNWNGRRSDRGDAAIRVDSFSLSTSETILRTWNALYFAERLCKTELEHALFNGPDAMRKLFQTGVAVAYNYFCNANHKSLLEMAIAPELDSIEFAEIPSTVEGSDFLQCDYCGESIEKKNCCSACKVAMYCSRKCQRGDWKRHKPLCQRYKCPE